MKYLIMLVIVLGLAASDFATGIIKACCAGKPSSRKMRIGGLHKLGELVVMATACGLEIGLDSMGAYYGAERFAAITGNLMAVSVFCYITIMELISILENYAEINPDAKWAARILKKFKEDADDECDR